MFNGYLNEAPVIRVEGKSAAKVGQYHRMSSDIPGIQQTMLTKAPLASRDEKTSGSHGDTSLHVLATQGIQRGISTDT